MEIKRISLYDRLDRLNMNAAAHPEYDSTVVRSMARMPIARYLGDYETFCDFQIHTEVREDLPYQTVAKVIADQTWTPEDMGQILDMLAGPIIQIERAYQQGKSALLPYRKRARTAQRVESLASRLEGAGALAGPPYNLHRMPVQRFFWAVSKLTADLSFPSVYQTYIHPHMPDENTPLRKVRPKVGPTKAATLTNTWTPAASPNSCIHGNWNLTTRCRKASGRTAPFGRK